ncbi:MAG TPA: 16S rRNA (cytosine(1402)-N(4))-methyltransferase RsmH [Clostridia bacterium]|nr:16S rRNA (cytosine(1402)-N(4))-methyltransferase RsmH [Clostridia bacterium]
MSFQHQPVLLQEVINYLNPVPGMVILDCTLGGGGHAQALLSRILPGGCLIGLDQDQAALEAADRRLALLGKANYQIVHANFKDLDQVLLSRQVDGILFDLGVSSYQLDQKERGFSYQEDVPLDMRMDQTTALKAFDLVNEGSLQELTKIIGEYGEEKWAKRIASFIVQARKKKSLHTTGQLVEIIKQAIPSGARRQGPHPAKRTFQALRIAVNQELDVLVPALEKGLQVLKPAGRMVVITFHSLEDRLVKRVFQKWVKACTCPADFPVCVCENRPQVKILTKKPVIPSVEEIEKNPRARSAKLRAVEKLDF